MVFGVSTPAAAAAAAAAAFPASDLERARSIFDSIEPGVMNSHNVVINAIGILCELREEVLSRPFSKALRGLSFESLRGIAETPDQVSAIELASNIQGFIDRLCDGSRIDFSTAKFFAGTHKEAIRVAELGLETIGRVQAELDAELVRERGPVGAIMIKGIEVALTDVNNALSPSFDYVTEIGCFGALNRFDEEKKLEYSAATMRTFEAAARVFASVNAFFGDPALHPGREDIAALKVRVRNLTEVLRQKITVVRGYHPIADAEYPAIAAMRGDGDFSPLPMPPPPPRVAAMRGAGDLPPLPMPPPSPSAAAGYPAIAAAMREDGYLPPLPPPPPPPSVAEYLAIAAAMRGDGDFSPLPMPPPPPSAAAMREDGYLPPLSMPPPSAAAGYPAIAAMRRVGDFSPLPMPPPSAAAMRGAGDFSPLPMPPPPPSAAAMRGAGDLPLLPVEGRRALRLIVSENTAIHYISLAEGERGHFEIRGQGVDLSWTEGEKVSVAGNDGRIELFIFPGEEVKLVYVDAEGGLHWQIGDNIKYDALPEAGADQKTVFHDISFEGF